MSKIPYLFLCLLLINCAHMAKTPDGKPMPDENTIAASGDDDGGDDAVTPGPEDEKPLQVGQSTPMMADLSDTETDMKMLPEDFNQNVNMWLDYFQGKGRPHMQRYLGRSTRYIPKMKEIFRAHGLPEDLVYIALIESGFNPAAYSHARAVGYWQFIRGTARRYDLRIDYYTDERSDFIASTEAAAQYLKALYNLFGSWYLAIASYNVGENRVKNMVMKHYTRDFWELAKKRRLPKETIQYVPKFLAARMIGKHPEKYGFKNSDIQYLPPLDFQEVKFDKAISLMNLAQQLGMDYEELHSLNPAYKKGVIPKYADQVVVRVPTSMKQEQVLAALENSATAVAMNQAVATEDNEYSKYRIRHGDTLSTISRRFRVSMGHLIEINDLSRRSVLHVGRTLRIPKSQREISSQRRPTSMNMKSRLPKLNLSRMAKADLKRKPTRQHTVHVVKTGETLINIANRYKVRMSQLISTNKLKNNGRILIGSRLTIPAQ